MSSKKNGSKSLDHLTRLRADVLDAESTVVSAAVAFVSTGEAGHEPLREAVTELLALRSAVQSIERIHSKAGKPAGEPVQATAKG